MSEFPKDHNQSDTVRQLSSYVSRIERLEEERKGLADDVKDIYTEAKSLGYDVKALRRVIARRKMDKSAREELDALIELYENSVESIL
jgi:uncharacterized protein (UPF0335 family)